MKFDIVNIESIASTNLYLLELIAGNYLDEGKVIITDNQTSGRGMGDNNWESENGKNLCFSLLLKPDFIKPESQFLITQIVSLALYNICNKYIDNNELKIKWPNDIYVGNKKLAGILVQNIISGNSISHSVIGIGLNVNQNKFYSNAPNPVSMFQLLEVETNRVQLLKEILNEIDNNYSRVRVFPKSSWLGSNYLKNLFRINQNNNFTDRNGPFNGEIIGISEYGQLQIKNEDGIVKTYNYKEVEFNF